MIFKIFKKDLYGLSRNILALIIAFGLCLIPSLYAWFNIYSNWDPYANTSSIKIAIVSDDEGYEQAGGERINMGSQVVKQLHSNDKLGWQFPDSSEEAINDLKAGKYYAVIIIGENFSSSLYDFLDNGLNPPTVTYYENSKKNAVASKITDTGKSTLQNTINTEFINVCVETIMLGLNEIGKKDPDVIAKMLSDLDTISKNVSSYNNTIDLFIESNKSLSANLASLQAIMPEIEDVLNDSTNIADVTNSTLDSISNDIMNQLDAQVQAMDKIVDSSLSYLRIAIQHSSDSAATAKENLMKSYEELQQLIAQSKNISDTIDQFSKLEGVDAAVIEAIKATLSSLNTSEIMASNLIKQSADMIGESSELLKAKADALKPILEECERQLSNAKATLETNLRLNINLLKVSIQTSVTSIANSISSAGTNISGVTKMLTGISDISVNVNTTLESSKVLLGSLSGKLTSLSTIIGNLDNNSTYQLIQDFIDSDAGALGSFLSEPVQVEQIDVYIKTNYGTSVTPFYTTLALWVGGIVLVALMKVKVDYKDDELAAATDNQKYFGRAILFLIMGQIQALVVVLGNLYLLKIDCTHPFMFWLSAAITSFVFTLFIYTLVLTFGDLGKAIAVVMIVLQIAGSGGTYPIELLPTFFQNIYLYFPFPYAINSMREAISGLYECDYAIYLCKLCIYVIVSLVIGLGIRKSILEIREFFERRMKETHFM